MQGKEDAAQRAGLLRRPEGTGGKGEGERSRFEFEKMKSGWPISKVGNIFYASGV